MGSDSRFPRNLRARRFLVASFLKPQTHNGIVNAEIQHTLTLNGNEASLESDLKTGRPFCTYVGGYPSIERLNCTIYIRALQTDTFQSPPSTI